jgi:hypothetical protein
MDGKFAAVDQDGNVFLRTGVNMDTPHGTDWMKLGKAITDDLQFSTEVSVTVGEEGQMYVLD